MSENLLALLRICLLALIYMFFLRVVRTAAARDAGAELVLFPELAGP